MSHSITPTELEYVAASRVGRLATADAGGRPSVVPFCFAILEHNGTPALVTALDEKPKNVPVESLARVRNIVANPRVSVVVDDYTDDWRQLRFVQISGEAHLVRPNEDGFEAAVAALRAKYPQYRSMEIDLRPIIRIDTLRSVSWTGDRRTGTEPRPADLASLIRGRRSVRALRPDPVPREAMERAIEAAGWAPSPHGRQPWRFSVVEAVERKERLANDMAATWREQLALDGQDAAVVQIRLEKSRTRILEAPLIVVPCLYLTDLDPYPDPERQAAERTMAIQSLGAAIENLMLSLYSEGLDTGWMCAPLFCPTVVRDALELNADLTPQALIPVGYAAKDPVRRARLPPDRLITDWR